MREYLAKRKLEPEPVYVFDYHDVVSERRRRAEKIRQWSEKIEYYKGSGDKIAIDALISVVEDMRLLASYDENRISNYRNNKKRGIELV